MTRTREDLERAFALTGLFIARHLGPRPRRVADQEAAIAQASDTLDALDSDEAREARRILAIEYTAYTGTRGKPKEADWQRAIGAVDAADDADVRRMAHGGLYLRARSGDWPALEARGL